MDRYFECNDCGQVVQGWNAAQQIDCCGSKEMVEIPGPYEDEADDKED